MGIRETLNENRPITIGATIGIIVLTIIWVFWYSFGGSSASSVAGKAFFTDDDGQTWFTDDALKTPPFDHKGKQAVLCFVFKCGDSGKPFVSHMLRYTDAGKKSREDQSKGKNFDPASIEVAQGEMEVKAGPGQSKKPQGWIKMTDPKAGKVQQALCPDGSTNNLEAMDPNS